MKKIKKFLFVNTSTSQIIIKNSFWLFTGEIGMRILKLVIFIYAARKLGTSEWGIFSYALALMSIFSVISDIGLNSVILRETAQKNNSEKRYIATGFFLKLGLSFLSGILFLGTIIFFKDTNPIKPLIPLMALFLFLDSLREFGFSLNRAYEKMEMEAIAKILATIFLVFFGFIFVHHQAKSISMVYAYLISGIIGILIMYETLRSHFKNLFSDFDKTIILKIFKEAWPIGTVAMLSIILSNVDTVILGWFKGSSQIGLYSAAQKPIQIIYLIPSILSTAILPLFSRMAIKDKEKMEEQVKKITYFSFLVGLFITIACLTVGSYIFLFLFGEQYTEAVSVFKILSIAIIIGTPGMILSNALFALGKQKKLLNFIILTMAINIILCLIFIPKFGINGAATAVTLSQIIGNLYLIWISKKY